MTIWPIVRLSDVSMLSSGGTPSKAKAAYWNGDIPWISPKDMKSNHLDDAEDKITKTAVSESAARIVSANSVLVVVRSGILAHTFPVATVGRDVSFNQDIKAVTPKNGSLLSQYLFWMLKGQEAQVLRLGVKKGATVHSLSNGFLEGLRFPLPPLDEQRRIVGLLDRAAEIRRRTDAARAKARTIIPALFLDTFGDPATNPKGWPTTAIGDVAKLMGGGTPSKANPAFWSGTIPWVSPKDMKPPTILGSEDKITAAAMAASPVKLIPAGNVLIVVRGMILAHTVPIRMNAVDVTLNQDMKALIPHKQILATFLRWALGSLHGYLLSKVRESAHGTKKLETDVLASYPIVLPPMKIQAAFAEHVQRLESLTSHLDAAAAKADALSAALSAEVFGQPQARVEIASHAA